jgi:tRNA (adenine57-N1/adenine58-N1)-methyltransferase
LLHLKRDLLIPTVLDDAPPTTEADYAEGTVTNTRFGSFPHSTLIDQPWGTQILASNVDTGSRGGRGKKRKREGGETTNGGVEVDGEEFKGGKSQAAEVAKSGFIHLVPPTPEAWTISLPHRTQVVYTPDYSFILQKLRARPGDHIIEAGAGSGSFTHAAARAVFNGYPDVKSTTAEPSPVNGTAHTKAARLGKVYSFEYHQPRATALASEIAQHGLSSVVRITHRDVYNEGFCLPESPSEPAADCIFLDLPAPWLAIKHLTRTALSASALSSLESSTPQTPSAPPPAFTSPLNPKSTTRICTFSPCIEQVQRTVTAMRQLGWVEITMSELQHHRIDVRRERVGLAEEGLRGANASAATVDEAVKKLREVEGRFKAFHESTKESGVGADDAQENDKSKAKASSGKQKGKLTKQQRLESLQAAAESRSLFKEGRLLHRTEQELKTHTSYLVFAVLPRLWTNEDEEKCRRKWG